ncbi:uncharacterized protein LOC113332817 [Papaver somniferum]|uniref:uncharacterized protein LOC113332817 n=1 Tax=Papaver somniferum TaxID=3469 RepID=UPI000E6F4EA2|nr:uncharacterized protein LOC113332817 [Papaver somniferum]
MARDVSDHAPLIGFPFETNMLVRAPFRIQRMWFEHDKFMDMVRTSWNAPLQDSKAYIFPNKLRRLKEAMKLWNREVFGDVHIRLKRAELHLEAVQAISDLDPSDDANFNLLTEALVSVDLARVNLATMLKQKVRTTWIMDGDSNTSFFHNSIHMRRNASLISNIVSDAGTILNDSDQIRDHILDYYFNKFNGSETVVDMDLFDYEHPSINYEDSMRMDAVPELEEIKDAVFHLRADSAPSPDSFSGIFCLVKY